MQVVIGTLPRGELCDETNQQASVERDSYRSPAQEAHGQVLVDRADP